MKVQTVVWVPLRTLNSRPGWFGRLLDVFWPIYTENPGGGRFVVTGTDGEIITSPDGETWTQQAPPENLRDMAKSSESDLKYYDGEVAIYKDGNGAYALKATEPWGVVFNYVGPFDSVEEAASAFAVELRTNQKQKPV